MAAKDIHFRDTAWDDVIIGVTTLAKTVKVTLGPKGRNVVINKSFGAPVVTKDGVTVAKEIELSNKFQNIGAQMVKEVASKTNDVAGDGTTTATVLAEAIFKHGAKLVTAGANPMDLKRGIDQAVKVAVAALEGLSRPMDGTDEIARVGAISANGDQEVGDILARAMSKIGMDGIITIEEANGLETQLEIVEGMQFDRGYLSPYFVTNPDSMEAVLEDAVILIHEKKISSMNDLLPVLEKVHEAGKPLLIIAEDVDGDALATLVVNKLRGNMNVCAIKAPGFGDRRKAMLEDLAVLTGGKAIMDDLGIKLDAITVADLGSARRVVITKDHTTVVDGEGERSAVKARVKQIRRQVKDTSSDYDREKLQERLAKLIGGVAVIHVGAATEVEMKEKKARVEDALNATRAATEEGIVPGGGVALVRAWEAVSALEVEGDEGFGVSVIANAILEPLRAIASNAGIDGSLVLHKVKQGEGAFGFNAASEEYGDMIEMGVLDPTKVVRTALQNAASVAGLLLTTEAMIAEKPEEGGGGAMGGMPGGMPGGMGGGMPGGGMPGGGIIGGMPGGLAGKPGGMPGGSPRAGSPAALGCIWIAAGPPTPLTGPAKPAGAELSGAAGMPRPATCPRPGPAWISVFFGPEGGGASAISVTIVSPRSTTKPSTLFTSFSSSLLPLDLIFLNSSQSASTTFMNLSKAMKVPTSMRWSEIVTRTR